MEGACVGVGKAKFFWLFILPISCREEGVRVGPLRLNCSRILSKKAQREWKDKLISQGKVQFIIMA